MRHLRALDGLRAVAIIVVFIAHCGLERVVPGGFGVTIFFFLSGFLITSLLRSEIAQTGRVDLKTFYIRRTLRIWPPLYLTMLFAGLLTAWIPSDHPITVAGVVLQLAFLSNYAGFLGGGTGVPWIPLWSLAVEEHFYLIFPPLLAVLGRRTPPRRCALWCAFGCFAILIVRIAMAASGVDLGSLYYWSHTRIDSILFGCCLAMWQNPALDKSAWRPGRASLLAAIAVLLLCLIVRNELFRQTLRYSLQGAALFVVFAYAIVHEGWLGRLLGSVPARLIALYSYTLYLVHVPMIEVVHHFAPGLGIPGVALVSGTASMTYAAAMYALVELPAAKARRALHRVDAQVDDTRGALGTN